MIELLKQVEDQSAANEDEPFHQSDEEDEEDSLVNRFSAIDICESSSVCFTPNE